jgi:hypothetical protein
LAERIGNLSHRRYLPVKVPAIDNRKSPHLGLTGIHVHRKVSIKELELGTAELVLCSAHKLQETWDVKSKSLEEANFELLEARGGDPTNKRF